MLDYGQGVVGIYEHELHHGYTEPVGHLVRHTSGAVYMHIVLCDIFDSGEDAEDALFVYKD